jgi:GNAT superfamily N-acetyltransferase
MQTKTTIKLCTKDDFSWVLKLLKQLWPKRTFVIKDVKKTFNDAIQSGNQFYFCAKQKEEIVWFGSFTIKNGLYAMGKVAILDELIVDDNHRKEWIAKILVDHMVNFAKKKKCVCIELECWSHRKPAHAFYENYWFEKWEGCFFSKDLV